MRAGSRLPVVKSKIARVVLMIAFSDRDEQAHEQGGSDLPYFNPVDGSDF